LTPDGLANAKDQDRQQQLGKMELKVLGGGNAATGELTIMFANPD
jgi:hypothetical protein